MTMTLNGSGTGTVGVPNVMTAQDSTSGTAIDFTGIPAGTKRITVMFNGVSTNGTSNLLIQIGSSSITSTGYNSTSSRVYSVSTAQTSSTSGFVIYSNLVANIFYGHMTITNVSSNVWVESSTLTIGVTNLGTVTSGGGVSLSGVLDRVRITTANGTDAFDAGSINILYE